MKITAVKIYDFAESIAASGLPMAAQYEAADFTETAGNIDNNRNAAVHFCRIFRLASNPGNSGHANALKGITVAMNVSGTIKWWEQAQRYHFFTIVSSQSTMHRLIRMDFDDCMSDKVLPEVKEFCGKMVEKYNRQEIDFDTLVDNMPLGIVLTARVTTNYLQLRTMYQQRKEHKYHEWKPFIEWVKTLPMAEQLITVDDKKCNCKKENKCK